MIRSSNRGGSEMPRIAVTAVVTALICFTISATTGFGARTRAAGQFDVVVGDTVFVPSLDLFCTTDATGPTSGEPGPTMECHRNSTAPTSPNASADVAITRFHMYLSAAHSTRWNYVVARTP